ncbi:MAG: flagellar type III secretion system pore protein FliP [Bdellovibrionales bacterium]
MQSNQENLKKWKRCLKVSSICFLLALAIVFTVPAFAQSLTLNMGGEGEGGLTGRIVQLVLMITALSLAPSLLIMVTSFTRIIVVLSLLRSAIGTAQTPPNMVLISLALFLTFFVMAPVLDTAWTSGVQPLLDGKIEEQEAFDKTVAPFRTFMLAHTREADLRLFMDLGKVEQVKEKAEVPLTVLIPSFMISELHRAFEIGFLLFLPFLIIDMVIASLLMSMGMMMLPPIVISLPFKIIFFVLVDGWYLVAGSLVRSYGG